MTDRTEAQGLRAAFRESLEALANSAMDIRIERAVLAKVARNLIVKFDALSMDAPTGAAAQPAAAVQAEYQEEGAVLLCLAEAHTPQPAAQPTPKGPVLHMPSGFAFGEVLAAVEPSDLVALTPQPEAQPAEFQPFIRADGKTFIDDLLAAEAQAAATPSTGGDK